MTKSARYGYEIDGNDRIVHVDDAWLSFARENGTDGLTPDKLVDVDLHLFIAGWGLSELYRELFQTLRHTCSATTLPFRCDSPGARRYMQLDLSGLPGGHIRLAGRVVRIARRRRFRSLIRK